MKKLIGKIIIEYIAFKVLMEVLYNDDLRENELAWLNHPILYIKHRGKPIPI